MLNNKWKNMVSIISSIIFNNFSNFNQDWISVWLQMIPILHGVYQYTTNHLS